MKCPKCGIELLGAMKKCPKCGYDTVTGVVDQNYMNVLEQSREKTPEPQRWESMICCEGKYYDGIGKVIPCEIQVVDNTILRVCKSRKKSKGRIASRAAFGLVGQLMYDSAHEDEYNETFFSTPLENIKEVARSNNPKFTMGWSVTLNDENTVYLEFSQPILGFLRKNLNNKWK